MIFNKQNKMFFLDPNCEYQHTDMDEKLDIVLSPSLYWVKKMVLPLNSLRGANKLLPSLFEEVLPEGIYSYSAYKTDNDSEFYIFAYEDKKILDVLNAQNIPVAKVASVHFAQSELIECDNAMQINESQSIYVKDSIVVLVPNDWVEVKEALDLSLIKLSKQTITLKQFGHIVDYKNIYAVAASVLILIFLVFIELFISTQRLDALFDKQEVVFSDNHLKPTMFENKAILQEYKDTHIQQTRLRKYTSQLLALKLNAGEKMNSISLKSKTLSVDFTGVPKNKQSHITSVLKSKGVLFTQKNKNDTLHLDMKI